MKFLKSTVIFLVLFTGCSSNSGNNSSSNMPESVSQKVVATDDLYVIENPTSPFARPKGAKIGFDVDGVLHTEVQYTINDFFFYKRPAFETVERNPRLMKEIEFLLINNNQPRIITHNKSVCDTLNNTNRNNLLASNGLPEIDTTNVFCVNHKSNKSIEINKQNITLFYDDSPGVLAEVAVNSPTTKLFMPLPKIQKVAHYFSDGVLPTKFVAKCGVLVVDDSMPQKRFLLQLRSPKLKEWWNFPGGSCAYHDNKKKNCAKGECEDPISGAIREFNEEAGKYTSLNSELDLVKRFMVLQSNDYMLFVVKLDKNYLDNRKFIPQDKFAGEVHTKSFNIPNSPGYRWFSLDECKAGAKVDGYDLKLTGNTCDMFRKYLEEF